MEELMQIWNLLDERGKETVLDVARQQLECIQNASETSYFARESILD